MCAVLTSGTLEKNVIVSVGSSDGTANGEYGDHMHISNSSLLIHNYL